jgi:hypothetical protein
MSLVVLGRGEEEEEEEEKEEGGREEKVEQIEWSVSAARRKT